MRTTDQKTAPTGLFVMFTTPIDCDVPIGPDSWCVLLHQGARADRGVIVWGFASKRDAEIAMASLAATSIRWSGELQEVIADVKKFGGLKELRRCAVQNLPW
jgi:hypothetical protein